jgi:hypothetical protein
MRTSNEQPEILAVAINFCHNGYWYQLTGTTKYLTAVKLEQELEDLKHRICKLKRNQCIRVPDYIHMDCTPITLETAVELDAMK